MPSPFPGMDPYIEDQEWSDFHTTYAGELRAQLAPCVEPAYFVRVERRVYIEYPEYDDIDEARIRVPDVSVMIGDDARAGGTATASATTVAAAIECEIPEPEERRETYLLIKETKTHDVITVIELLSPSNKRKAGDGWHEYLRKRNEVLRGKTHLVELDLLLRGARMPMKPQVPTGNYLAMVSREDHRPHVEVYAWRLADPLPTIPVPLKGPKESVPLNLQEALTAVYDRARYGLSIDYSAPLKAKLSEAQSKWLAGQLAETKTA